MTHVHGPDNGFLPPVNIRSRTPNTKDETVRIILGGDPMDMTYVTLRNLPYEGILGKLTSIPFDCLTSEIERPAKVLPQR